MMPVAVDVPYALELSVVTEARVPVAGKRRVVTRSYAAIDFERRGEEWVQIQRPCAVEVDGGRVSFPDSFIGSLPVQETPVDLDDAVYHLDPGPSFVGVHGEPTLLPDKRTDPRVVDQDGDGHPGVTVYLDLPVFGAIELYIIQAAHTRYEGVVDEQGAIRGRVDIERLEQQTLGASIGLFAANVPVEVLEADSGFRMVPDPRRLCRGAFTD